MTTDELSLTMKQVKEAENASASFRDYVSLTKIEITVANLMATFAGLWVASHGHPRLSVTAAVLLGTALVVGAGAIFNNFLDRDIDVKMLRTQERAIASGKVAPERALALGAALGAVGLVDLLIFVNPTAALTAAVGLVMYSYIYTVWLKRKTTLSTVLGGIAGAAPPLVGFAAGSGGSLGFAAWAMFFIFFLWQPPHFLPLAMKRSEEYRAAGIPMLPVVRGFGPTKWQILRYTAALLPVSVLLYAANAESLLYLVTALGLGIWFLVLAIQGLFVEDDLAWARKVFKFSLIYLTVLCVAMVVGVYHVVPFRW